MSRFFLTRLQVEGFRGINNDGDPLDLSFATDKVNSVFGENARGKSSIFEALSYAITGKIPKLEQLPADDKAGDYYCNRFHSTETAKIVLSLQSDSGGPPVEVRITRSKSGKRAVDSPTGHADPEGLLRQLADDLTLLDYGTFRSFVEDSPLKRGRAFSALLGLSQLSSFRQTLETLSNDRNLKTDVGLADDKSRLTQTFTFWNVQLNAIAAAEKKLLGSASPPQTDLNQIETAACEALAQVPLIASHFQSTELSKVDFTAVRATIRQAEGSAQRAKLEAAIRGIAALENLAALGNESTDKETFQRRLQARDAALKVTKGALHFRLYEAVDAVLTAKECDPLICPACELDQSEPLDVATKNRIAKYSDVAEERNNIKQLWKTGSARQRISSLETNQHIGIPPEKQKLAAFDQTFSGDPTESAVTEVFDYLDSLQTARAEKIQALIIEKQAIEKDLPPSLVALTEQVEAAESVQTAVAAIRSYDSQVIELGKTIAIKQRWVDFITGAADIFSKAEVALSTAQTNAFEAQYRKLYEKITNNPDIVPVLQKSKGSEELYLRLKKFHTLSDVSAATLLPESYRNALAISIYLAAALNSAKASRFIVLDDITSSFDAGHQFCLMEVLRTEIVCPQNPQGLQILLLSHDGLLEKYFDKMSSDAEWKHCRLDGLPPCGKVLTNQQNNQTIRTDAETFAKAGQLKQAAPLIRQYLEQSLLLLLRTLEVPVPVDFSIRDEKKMVQACLDAIDRDLDLHEKAGTLTLTTTQLNNWRKVLVPQLFSNFLNHYATGSAASISPPVYLAVIKAIDDAIDCFKYPCTCSGTKSVFYKSLSKRNRKGCTC